MPHPEPVYCIQKVGRRGWRRRGIGADLGIAAVLVCICFLVGTLEGCEFRAPSGARSKPLLQLPLGLDRIVLGAGTAEVSRQRTDIKWNESCSCYLEEFADGLPFVRFVEYRFKLGKLRKVVLWREWTLDKIGELRAAIPGLVMGAQGRWGGPDMVGLFRRPKSNERAWQVALIWRRPAETLVVSFPSLKTATVAESAEDASALRTEIALLAEREATAELSWMELVTDSSRVGEYYDPASLEGAQGPVLR